MQRRKRRLIILYCLALTIVFVVSVILINLKFKESYIAIVGLLGSFLFFIYVFSHYKIVSRFLNFGLIFSAMLFLFCFGQFFLFGLGVNYEYFFFNTYYSSLFKNNLSYVLYGEVVSIISIGLFQLSMLITARYKYKKLLKEPIITQSTLKTVALVLFLISFPIMMIYKLYLMFYSLLYGYGATGNLVQPAIVRFMGVFLIPSAIALLVCFMNKKRKFIGLSLLLLFYAGIGLLIGGRTEPLMLITSIGVLFLYNKKLTIKTSILLVILVYVLATLMVSVAEIRVTSFNISYIFEVFFNNLITFRTITQLIGEMGFSGSSMIWVVYLVKSGQQELYWGLTYIGAFVNIIPSSLDVFGIISCLDKYCHLESWLTELFNFNFGVGFNLIAEAYLNFGFGAIIVMFFYGLLLNHIFNLNLKKDAWNVYKSLVMFVTLMTLPRRASLYFADQWTLCVIMIWLFCEIEILCKRKNQRVLINGKVAN